MSEASFVNHGQVQLGSINTFGFKNRLINGQMQIAQRGTKATIPANADIPEGYKTVDRWYVYCTGGDVVAEQVEGTGNIKNNLQLSGGGGTVGVGQRIESVNSRDLAGNTVTLSANISNSSTPTIYWSAYYANAPDRFGTLLAPKRRMISRGSWTVTNKLSRYDAQINLPDEAINGIEIVFTYGGGGTFLLGNVQLEMGFAPTAFDYRPFGTELTLCQRYCYATGGVSSNTTKANAIVATKQYQIEKLGNTNFTSIGATVNSVGEIFIATAPGTGTGTAINLVDRYNAIQSTGYWANSSNGYAYFTGQFGVSLRSPPTFSATGNANSYGIYSFTTNPWYQPVNAFFGISNVSSNTFYMFTCDVTSTANIGTPFFLTDYNGNTFSNNWIVFSAEL
jgi:hypothetical protein